MPETVPSTANQSNLRTGVTFAVLAQLVWGLFPLYLKLLEPTPAVTIVAYRVVWAFSFLAVLVFVTKWIRLPAAPKWSEIRAVLGNPKTLRWQLFASVLILINWLGFVAAVALDRTMDASIGYYICPQVVVLLGVIFQKERFSRIQWLAFGFTSLGVLVMAASSAGIPWLGLVVAFSFGFYALTKKRIDCSALTGLTFETGIWLLPAVGFLLYGATFSGGAEAGAEMPDVGFWSYMGLLAFLGVLTVLPLALYVDSVKRIPLSLVGLLQFVGPTIQFLLSVFVLRDSFDWPRGVGIVLIWIGVIIYLRVLQSNAAK